MAFWKKNEFEGISPSKSVRFGVVTSVDAIPITTNNKGQKENDKRYNADPFIIRTRVLGSDYDKNKSVNELPNCFPMIPKHVSVPPKVGELVLLFFFSEDLKNSDRLYIGPLISNLDNIFKDEMEDATSAFSTGIKSANKDLSQIEELKGVYPSNKDVSFQGRNNADICFGDAEIRLRAGKFVTKIINGVTKKEYNRENPAYIQIKYNAPLEKPDKDGKQKRGSVTNIVSDRINILGVRTPIVNTPFTGEISLTDRDKLIDDESLIAILERAEPVVLGNKLIDYLTKLEKFVLNHIHNGTGTKPETQKDEQIILTDLSAIIKTDLLSKNVRIN